jgi:hypothetical protein
MIGASFLDRGGDTLEEVGGVLGVTRERIRQIESRALRKLRGRASSAVGRDWVGETLRELSPGPERYRKPIQPSESHAQIGDVEALRAILLQRGDKARWTFDVIFPRPKRELWQRQGYRAFRSRQTVAEVREALEEEFGPTVDPDTREALREAGFPCPR